MKLLFLTSRFPFPIEKGDKLRAFYFIKHLSRYHDIYLFAINDKQPDDKSIKEIAPYCKTIEVQVITAFQSLLQMITALSGSIPFSVAYFTNKGAKKKLAAFVNKHQPDKVFCHLIRMAEYAHILPGQNAIIDYMDAFSIGMQRHAALTAVWKKVPFYMEAQRLKKYESKVFERFRQHIIISAQDRQFIHHPQNKSITVIPNGVEFDFFIPLQEEKKQDLLFVGNMAYPPNIESATYSVKKILPVLHQTMPGINLLIAGATPVKQVTRLQSDKVKVSGWVDDIRLVFAQSRIMIAPMLISIGLQNKILQAMAMKIPCVVSRLANNAIDAPDDCICVADNPQGMPHTLLIY